MGSALSPHSVSRRRYGYGSWKCVRGYSLSRGYSRGIVYQMPLNVNIPGKC